MSIIKRQPDVLMKKETTFGSAVPSGPAEILKPTVWLQLPLHVRLRPRRLEDVVGHEAVVKALGNLLRSKDVPHAFLFTGQSGGGKTTLARIIGEILGCQLIEIDAARHSGVDNMRDVILGSRFQALQTSGRKKIVIDECHMLSKGAWNSLLLSIEEPPPHLFWSFCTTEPDKVPATIRTRCHAFDLRPLPWETVAAYLEKVVKKEQLPVRADMIDIIARRCLGSVRQALVYLSSIEGIEDKAEAMRLVESADSEEGNPGQLARMICTNRGFSWDTARKLVQGMSDESPEGIRLVVVNYATKMIMDSKSMSEGEAQRLLAVLEAFSRPYNLSERQAPLLLAIGALLFGG